MFRNVYLPCNRCFSRDKSLMAPNFYMLVSYKFPEDIKCYQKKWIYYWKAVIKPIILVIRCVEPSRLPMKKKMSMTFCRQILKLLHW